MRSVVLTAVIACCSWFACAQVSLQGRISNGVEFLPGVSVMLLKDSTLLLAVLTDSSGRYVFTGIATGSYRVRCSFIGYDPFVSSILVPRDRIQIEVPGIILRENAVELDAVEVTANRMAVDHQPDRLVIRPGDAITYAGNSVLEVLQRSPGVSVNRQSGAISVSGRSGVRIFINDKAVQVSPEIALQMLDGMSADQVERIELITAPSAAYDAEGSGGMINIVTRKDNGLGTNGSMTATVGAHWAETLGFAGNVNRRTRRFAYYVDYSILRNHNQHVMHMYREVYAGDVPVTSTDDSPRKNLTTQQNFRGGMEWLSGKRWTFSLQTTGYSRDWSLDASAYNTTTSNGSPIGQATLHATESNIWRSATGSLAAQYQLNTLRRINVAIDYLYYHNNNPSNYTGEMADADEISLSKQTPIQFVVATVQFLSGTPRAALSWDAGVKAVFSSFDNRVDVQRLANGMWMPDTQFSSNATAQERILAAHIATVWKPGKAWEVNAGLRYEYTHTDVAQGSDQSMLRQYGNFFPQLSVRRHLPGGDELYVAFSRRITRPTYNDMAPYVFFWSANSFSSGNTFLLPALSNSITAGLQRRSWSWIAAYSRNKNAIAQMQPEMVNDTSLVYRSQNLDALNTWSLSVSYRVPVYSWWELRGELVAQYQRAAISCLPVHVDRSLWGVNVNVHSSVKLPRQFSFEVSAMYQSRSLSGVSEFLPYGSLDAAVAKRIGRNGSLKLAFDDILYTNQWWIRTSSPENNLNVHFDYDWHNRFIRISCTWTLGNAKVAAIKSAQASDDERRRVDP